MAAPGPDRDAAVEAVLVETYPPFGEATVVPARDVETEASTGSRPSDDSPSTTPVPSATPPWESLGNQLQPTGRTHAHSVDNVSPAPGIHGIRWTQRDGLDAGTRL